MTEWRRAAFLDRDGVLIEDRGYPHRPEHLFVLAGVPEALARLREAGFLLVVVTNQSGIARGLFSAEEMHRFHDMLQERLSPYGATVDAFYHCPHHPSGSVAKLSIACDCRKPAPGMIRQALADWKIDPEASFIAGDKESDIAAGRAAGLGRCFLIGAGNTFTSADSSHASLADCVSGLLDCQAISPLRPGCSG